MKRLTTHIKNFTNVIHIGDIHCRLNARHQEYIETFDKLYKSIDRTPETTLIVIAGDIFHSKVDLSPESIKLVLEFLKALADKRPTILIAGNHDALLSNKNRMDSLSPIVNALNHNNLYYLRETDYYIIGDVLFNNYGIFDSVDKYVKYKDIPSVYRNEVNYNIALFHGPVNNAITDIGYIISNRTIMVDIFDGHQMVMLGDIHKHQILQQYDYTNDKPVIVYAGSLIQQDHGENLKGHGFVYWDLKSKKFAHIDIPNDYGFYTVEVNKGVLSTDIKDIPKKAKLRIKCIESVPTEIKSVLLEIRKVSDITDVTYIRADENNDARNIINANQFNLQNISDVDYQNNLIKEYIENKNIKVSESTLKCIFSLNKNLNDELKGEYIPRNIRWKPKIFEFDNMFSYGEGNIIDFSKMNGNMGLFASNSSGKSSILSALSFCLFDKCDRSFKASYILNSQKMSFRCKFNFEINKIDYFIERKGISDKKGNVKVDVKFWKIVDNKEVELNGEARRSTNDIIRDYIGEYEDFILTVLSVQNGKDGSFVDMGQTERKDLLSQFMGLNIFDKLSNLSMDKYKEISILLKNLNTEDYTIKFNDVNLKIRILHEQIEQENLEIERILREKEENNNKLIDLTKQLINVNLDVGDIVKLEKDKIKLDDDINNYTKSINLHKDTLCEYDNRLKSITLELGKLDAKNFKENLQKYKMVKASYSKLELDIDKMKVTIKNKLEKLAKLEEHKYDPNCDFCINNVFVKDAIKTKQELENDRVGITNLMESFKICKQELSELNWVDQAETNSESLNREKTVTESEISKLHNVILKAESTASKANNDLMKLVEKIDYFYQQKENIESNTKINADIMTIKSSIKDLDAEYKIKNKNLMNSNMMLHTNMNDKLQIEENIIRFKELESKSDCYKYYMQAISRDGIPYELITQALPAIEKEVNDILRQIVDFRVILKTDGKFVSTYIAYDDKQWPLEMSGGMEKFISSLAIRVALINISNLPRPNILIIDEGFGSLDANHLSEIKLLFSYLKNHFDITIIISHLDSIKDYVDGMIEITKEFGMSKVKFI